MTTNTHNTVTTQLDAGYETSTFALGVAMTSVAIVAIWGTACLASAMVSMGPLNVAQAYFTALIG